MLPALTEDATLCRAAGSGRADVRAVPEAGPICDEPSGEEPENSLEPVRGSALPERNLASPTLGEVSRMATWHGVIVRSAEAKRGVSS